MQRRQAIKKAIEKRFANGLTLRGIFSLNIRKTTSIDLSSLRPSSQYKDLGEYYAELNPLLYHISFQRIAERKSWLL